MKKSFAAIVVVELPTTNYKMDMMDILVTLKTKGIAIADSLDKSPVVLEFKLEDIKK